MDVIKFKNVVGGWLRAHLKLLVEKSNLQGMKNYLGSCFDAGITRLIIFFYFFVVGEREACYYDKYVKCFCISVVYYVRHSIACT